MATSTLPQVPYKVGVVGYGRLVPCVPPSGSGIRTGPRTCFCVEP
uniref:Aspartate dehydrogenase domain containing n=1 Tax=Mus musculus TaxID=10090 RepID=D6RE19_MOUSE